MRYRDTVRMLVALKNKSLLGEDSINAFLMPMRGISCLGFNEEHKTKNSAERVINVSI